MAQVSVSDTAIRRVLEELLRSPIQASPRRSTAREANVETLQQATGLARGTVHNALSHLAPILHRRSHWQERGSGRRGGKPTILHRVSPDAAQALVLDFEHDRVRLWVADAIGNLSLAAGDSVEVDSKPTQALKVAGRLIKKYSRADWEKVVGIGLSLPAPVDPKSQRTVGGVLPGWEQIDVEGLLHEHLSKELAGRKLEIIADNDGNLAALAEHRYGKTRSRPEANLFFVKTVPGRIGIGAGAVINGRPLRSRGLAMEFGHLRVDAPYPSGATVVQCPHCGNTDCLQARLSTNALIGGDPPPQWEHVVKRTIDTVGSIAGTRTSAMKAKDMSLVAELGPRLDTLATNNDDISAIVTAGHEMGRALAKVATLLDPDIIVLGGPLAKAWLDELPILLREVIGDPVRDALNENAPLKREQPIDVAWASPTGDCGHGAAAAVFDVHLVDFLLRRVKLLAR
jgi:predicted NBD/HSP70 family sugar kinase